MNKLNSRELLKKCRDLPAINRCSVMLIFIALTAAWILSDGLYVYAKAKAGQYLLQQAWVASKKHQAAIKPWPWADTWPVARLKMPAKQVDLIVLAGDSGRTLAWGPGYQLGSVLPGNVGNSIISGHRDTHFAFLQYVTVGDWFEITDQSGEVYTYQVRETAIIDSRSDKIRIDPDSKIVTLLTCYPFDAVIPGGPLRYMVVLENVDYRIQPDII